MCVCTKAHTRNTPHTPTPKCNGVLREEAHNINIQLPNTSNAEDEILITLRYLCNPQWCLI